jgi:hypothetical protein
MTRALAKFAFYVLAVATIVDLARFSARKRAKVARKEAIMSWENEGGALPETH